MKGYSYLKYILALVPILLVGFILYWLGNIVLYIIIAWVISMIGSPLVALLRRFMNRNAAAMITLLSFVLIFILTLYFFIPVLVTQAKYLAGIDVQNVVSSIEEPLQDWKNWLVEKKLIVDDEIFVNDNAESGEQPDLYVFQQELVVDSLLNPSDSSHVNNIVLNIKIDASDFLSVLKEENLKNSEPVEVDFFEKLKNNLSHYLSPQRIQQIFSSTVSAFGNAIVGIMSVLFISFFFLKEQGLFKEMIVSMVPRGYEERAEIAFEQMSNLLIRYFIGIAIQVTIITLYVTLLLTIMGVKNAVLIGFFAAIMNVIPYLGPIIGAAFGIIITISSNLEVPFYDELLPQLGLVGVTFATMQLIDNFILQPNIFSKSVKAHPLEIFLIVLIGAKLGGIPGMVLAIPGYTVLRVVGKVFLSEFKIIERLTRNMDLKPQNDASHEDSLADV